MVYSIYEINELLQKNKICFYMQQKHFELQK